MVFIQVEILVHLFFSVNSTTNNFIRGGEEYAGNFRINIKGNKRSKLQSK